MLYDTNAKMLKIAKNVDSETTSPPWVVSYGRLASLSAGPVSSGRVMFLGGKDTSVLLPPSVVLSNGHSVASFGSHAYQMKDICQV